MSSAEAMVLIVIVTIIVLLPALAFRLDAPRHADATGRKLLSSRYQPYLRGGP
jgi:hypothetical protein